MLAVCAVLSIAATVAIPSAAPVAGFQADAAAGEVELALRFARDEALRTGELRMVRCEQQLNRVRVVARRAFGTILYDSAVQHPGSRQPYSVPLATTPAGSDATLAGCSFTFSEGAAAAEVAFDANGMPVRGSGDEETRKQALASGAIVVRIGNTVRTVTVGVTGRVTTS